uniref:Dirigent protein n=1 Tax=Davidia involucrata TaxID=16924 RepID=A0A5B7BXQ9_DAVIN
MAPKTVTRCALLSSLLLLAIVTHSEAKFGKIKETNMVFYMHDIETGTNATAIPVAGIPNKRWWILGFGTVYAVDEPLTEQYDQNSTQVGRAHGIYVNSALDGSDLHFLMSLVFTNKAFNGSTLEIQGADRFYQKYREVSVVSGTGKFRLARGYAILETVYLDLVNFNAIIRWNLTVYHY